MPAEAVVNAANFCQAAVPFISLMAYLPQWVKLYRTKSSAAISVRSWCAWTVTSSFALFYAAVQLLLNGRGWALVLATTLGLAFVLITLGLVIKYRRG